MSRRGRADGAGHWGRVVADWRLNGLNRAEFSRRHDLGYQTMVSWVRRLDRSRGDPNVQAKVIDFGVARVTDREVAPTTLRTDLGQLIGTLPYTSPERVAGDTDPEICDAVMTHCSRRPTHRHHGTSDDARNRQGPRMISFELRPYDEENDDFLFDLYVSTRAEELKAWGWTEQQRELFLRQQYEAQRQSYGLQFEDADHQIIVFAGQPIGRMVVLRGEDEYRLVDISLLPQYRGTGIGTQILRGLLCEAFDARKPVRLSVVKINPAARLYLRLGFVVTDDDGLYLQMTADPRHG